MKMPGRGTLAEIDEESSADVKEIAKLRVPRYDL